MTAKSLFHSWLHFPITVLASLEFWVSFYWQCVPVFIASFCTVIHKREQIVQKILQFFFIKKQKKYKFVLLKLNS